MRKGWHKIAVGVIVSAGALFWFAHDVPWTETLGELSQVQPFWAGLAALILLGEFAIRSLRWKILLRPLGGQVSLRDLFVAQKSRI